MAWGVGGSKLGMLGGEARHSLKIRLVNSNPIFVNFTRLRRIKASIRQAMYNGYPSFACCR
jgi:hypothetical protein